MVGWLSIRRYPRYFCHDGGRRGRRYAAQFVFAYGGLSSPTGRPRTTCESSRPMVIVGTRLAHFGQFFCQFGHCCHFGRKSVWHGRRRTSGIDGFLSILFQIKRWMHLMGHCVVGGGTIVGHYHHLYGTIRHGWIFTNGIAPAMAGHCDTTCGHYALYIGIRTLSAPIESHGEYCQFQFILSLALCLYTTGQIQLQSPNHGTTQCLTRCGNGHFAFFCRGRVDDQCRGLVGARRGIFG
mmetsp:Transcript_27448/g.57479  ORF Transcript_27448/g.57479 Transcript_27448/m.57479 type:complete len:238 (-) Transcript_27448:514-1227(-)